MKKLVKLALAASVCVVLTACQSGYDPAERLKAEHEAQMLLQELKKERELQKSQVKNQLLDELPDWVVEPPKSDGYGVYAVGKAQSSNYANAMDRSRLDAKFQAAEQLKSEVSGIVRSHTEESGEMYTDSYSKTIEDFVVSVPVVGYKVVNTEIKEINNRFHFFILIHVPYAEFNKALQQMEKDDLVANDVEKAFKELERRVDKANGVTSAKALSQDGEISPPAQATSTASTNQRKDKVDVNKLTSSLLAQDAELMSNKMDEHRASMLEKSAILDRKQKQLENDVENINKLVTIKLSEGSNGN